MLRYNKSLVLVLVGACLLLGLGQALAQGESKQDGELVALNRSLFEQQMVHRNAELFSTIALEDFVVVAPGGMIEGKQQAIDGVQAFDAKGVSITEEQVTVNGDTALVVGKVVMDGVLRPVGDLGPMKFMSVFVKRDGQWRLLARSLTRCHEMAVARGIC